MNNALYEIASFMVLANRPAGAGATPGTTATRSSSAATRKSPSPGRRICSRLFLDSSASTTTFDFLPQSCCCNAPDGSTAEEKTFIPESEYGKVILRARIYLVIYAGVIGLAIYTRSILPLMFIGLPGSTAVG